MTAHPEAAALRWAEAATGRGARVTGSVVLRGGITASMYRLTVQREGETQELVLRQWVEHRDEAVHDGLVDREIEALEALSAVGRGVPAPRPIAADATGELAGAPSTLTTALPGAPELSRFDGTSLDRLARIHAAVHAVPVRLRAHASAPFVETGSGEWIADAGVRRAAVDAARADPNAEPVFVHGDFQPFNVLWAASEVSGVVDWPRAGLGDAGEDVGHCRLNLAVLADAEAADRYLDSYADAAGCPPDPAGDLRALLCWTPDWQRFIPEQLAGRRTIDIAGMRDRVVETIVRALNRR